jgi:hypothetical protein
MASFLGSFLQPQETMPQRIRGGLSDARFGRSNDSPSSTFSGGPVISMEDSKNCTLEDPWATSYLHKQFHRQYPFFNQTIFWKTTRILPEDIQDLIGWTATIHLNGSFEIQRRYSRLSVGFVKADRLQMLSMSKAQACRGNPDCPVSSTGRRGRKVRIYVLLRGVILFVDLMFCLLYFASVPSR